MMVEEPTSKKRKQESITQNSHAPHALKFLAE